MATLQVATKPELPLAPAPPPPAPEGPETALGSKRGWSRARKDPPVPTPRWPLPDWSVALTECRGGARVWTEKSQLGLELEVLISNCMFLGIYPFLLGYPFYWRTIVPSDLLWSFVFLGCHLVTPFFISRFIYLNTLSFILGLFFFFFWVG